jgi:hypothetical protein
MQKLSTRDVGLTMMMKSLKTAVLQGMKLSAVKQCTRVSSVHDARCFTWRSIDPACILHQRAPVQALVVVSKEYTRSIFCAFE